MEPGPRDAHQPWPSRKRAVSRTSLGAAPWHGKELCAAAHNRLYALRPAKLSAPLASTAAFLPVQLEIAGRTAAHNLRPPGSGMSARSAIFVASGCRQAFLAMDRIAAKPCGVLDHARDGRADRPAGSRLGSVAISDERARGLRAHAVVYALRLITLSTPAWRKRRWCRSSRSSCSAAARR